MSILKDEAPLDHYYPRTVQELRKQNLESFLNIFSRAGLPPHWFAGFLRQRELPASFYELANLEWTLQLMGTPIVLNVPGPIHRQRIFKFNPEVQILTFSGDQREHGIEKGLWAFVRLSGSDMAPRRFQLQKKHAVLLDLLNEDRKFSYAQLVEMAALNEPEISYENELIDLIENGIVI